MAVFLFSSWTFLEVPEVPSFHKTAHPLTHKTRGQGLRKAKVSQLAQCPGEGLMSKLIGLFGAPDEPRWRARFRRFAPGVPRAPPAVEVAMLQG